MKNELFAFILLTFGYFAQGLAHGLRTLNESKKELKLSYLWHIIGSLFLVLIGLGYSLLGDNYDYNTYEMMLFYVIYTALVHIMIFDVGYNIGAVNKFGYVGKTSIFDKIQGFLGNVAMTFIRMGIFVWLLAEAIKA